MKLTGTILGVDFSGAADPAEFIWIAIGRVEIATIVVETCRPIAEITDARTRDGVMAALRNELSKGYLAAGLDFPFALPAPLMSGFSSWRDFALRFDVTFADPEAFRGACMARAEGRELRRRTEVLSSTPFSPYNLRMYRQTFHGIRDVVAPLIAQSSIRAIPMEPLGRGARVIEICPASSLKAAGVYSATRVKQLDWLIGRGLSVPDLVQQRVLDEAEDDALDSLIALHATARALRTNFRAAGHTPSPLSMLEGFVFV
jgi:hypothetical protein